MGVKTILIMMQFFQKPGVLTDGFGHPLGDRLNSLTVGERGPMLLQDLQFIDEMAHFDRERIPERVVHAKGAGGINYLYFYIFSLGYFILLY